MNAIQGYAMFCLFICAFVFAVTSWWSMLAAALVTIDGCLVYWHVRRQP